MGSTISRSTRRTLRSQGLWSRSVSKIRCWKGLRDSSVSKVIVAKPRRSAVSLRSVQISELRAGRKRLLLTRMAVVSLPGRKMATTCVVAQRDRVLDLLGYLCNVLSNGHCWGRSSLCYQEQWLLRLSASFRLHRCERFCMPCFHSVSKAKRSLPRLLTSFRCLRQLEICQRPC